MVALFDDTGSVVERCEYDAYGKVSVLSANYELRTASLFANPYLFTGRRGDTMDSGSLTIYHYRARAYDPETGRFMQRDPLGYVDGMNVYEYVRSNSAKYHDSSGLRVDSLSYAACRAAGLSHAECVSCCHMAGTDRKSSNDYHDTYSPEEVDNIAKEEGFRDKVYSDTTGNNTIGYGTNLDRPGARNDVEAIGLDYNNLLNGKDAISRENARSLMLNDVDKAWDDSKSVFGDECWTRIMQETRNILTHMSYQLGRGGFSKFERMKSALCDGCKPDYGMAAEEMLNSKWANQTPNRAKRLADRMKNSGGN